MSFCLTSAVDSSHSMTMIVLTTVLVAATYNNSMSSGFGGTSVDMDFRYCLNSMKAATA
jgi:hypothetical protein